jgi:glycosyltransferase involved in cell wall biosynthesis
MIDVIIPTYNEEEIIGEFLKVLKKEMKREKFRALIIDDSTDNTASIAGKTCKKLKIQRKIIKRKNKRGKGSAVNTGLKELKARIGVIIDADLEYHPKHILRMVKKLKEYDFITSIRVRKDPWHRRILAKGFRLIVSLLYNIPFETQSGLKVFKTKLVKPITLVSKGWVWDVELIYKLLRKKARIGTHNISYATRKSGESKINLFTPFQMFIDLITLRLRV